MFGLGNPGRKYQGTRHNVGFAVLDLVADKYGIRLKERARLEAKTGEGDISGVRVMLIEPQTFMNNSGWSVSAVLDYYRAQPSDVIVVYDDIDLPFGHLRIREHGSAGTHNGMRSVISCLGSEDFVRLRVGIGQPEGRVLKDYVLSRFEDSAEARRMLTWAADALECLISRGVQAAQQEFREDRN